MKLDVTTGLIEGVKFIGSPNYDERPEDMQPEVLIIHAISLPPGEFGGPYIEQLFLNQLDPDGHSYFEEIKDLKVSSHLLIRRDGEVIQFVPLQFRAWHAGESSIEGRTKVNDFSIGIELEGTDDVPYEEVQYDALIQLTAIIREAYPEIRCERIYGHDAIAPGRKTDPGPYFDWQSYLAACLRS